MKTKILLGAGLGMCALAWAAKDPVIMKVNGVDVPKSEFEYLYHKNSQQQLTSQPIDEYVDLFVNYRLKVADAIADGVDTTAAFRQEMDQYRRELAAPYLVDSLLLNNLVEEAWQRSRNEVDASHIMIFKKNNAEEDNAAKATLDSLRKVALAGGDFADLADRYSQDRGTVGRGGNLGYMVAGRYPYQFEKTAFGMNPGEISDVVESRMAWHIIKVNDKRPARGQVKVAHILLQDPQDKDAAAINSNEQLIDSIYKVVLSRPMEFENLARQYSQDPGTSRQGGLLPWFGAGQMVPEFEEVAFATPVNSVSKPFRSQFGWHIIYKYDQKAAPALEEMKPMELSRIQNPQDERYSIVRKHEIERLSKKHKASFNKKGIKALEEVVAANGIDSTFYEKSAIDVLPVLNIGKKEYSVADFKSGLHNSLQPDKQLAGQYLAMALDNYMANQLIEVEEEWLENNEPEYRNLLHEYRNGSLLYESSVKNVWNKAAQDKEGLNEYFQSHKSDYKWIEPRVKGILVQAKNDSVANDIVRLYRTLSPDEAVSRLRKEYKGEAQIDKILMPKGQNALVDALMFGEGVPTPSNSNYTSCLLLDGRLLSEPEEIDDVKGQVTGDYQEALDEEWVAQLRQKYPVEINQKVLKSVK